MILDRFRRGRSQPARQDDTLVGRGPRRTPSGTPLPPPRLRMGGAHFRSDEDFLAGARADVAELQRWCGLCADSHVVDWGCGAGRLAVGLRETVGRVADYHGIDIQQRLVGWAERWLTAPGYRFTRVDVTHAHYNPAGRVDRSLPVADGSVDVFYAYSVFSHLAGEDTVGYLGALRLALAPEGRGWFTLFVEDGVPYEEENPAGYGPLAWSVPLHCVRYDRGWFEARLADAGLAVVDFVHGAYTDGQSRYVVGRVDRDQSTPPATG